MFCGTKGCPKTLMLLFCLPLVQELAWLLLFFICSGRIEGLDQYIDASCLHLLDAKIASALC